MSIWAALDSLYHRLHLPEWIGGWICDRYDLSLGTPDTPENFPRRHKADQEKAS